MNCPHGFMMDCDECAKIELYNALSKAVRSSPFDSDHLLVMSECMDVLCEYRHLDPRFAKVKAA